MPKLKLNSTTHVLPWSCFSIPTTTSSSSSSADDRSSTCIKLIMCNGQVKSYHHPVPASDLMSEFPSHLVCHSDSFLVGQKVPALDPSDTLQPSNSYFLLPSSFFRSVLSLVSIASSFSPSDRAALLKMVELQRTPSGKLRIRVRDDFMKRVDDDDDDDAGGGNEACGSGRGRVCTTAELQRVYKGMVRSRGEGWRPKLETIKEKEGRKKEKKMKTKHPKVDNKTQSKSRSRDKTKDHIQDIPPPPLLPKVTKCKKEDKDDNKKKKKMKKKEKEKENVKLSGKVRSQEEEYVDNCHFIPPPPLPPPKALESEAKANKDRKKTQLQEKGSHQHSPPPPPSSPHPSPTPPRGPFAAIKAKRKEKKRLREERENEKKR